MENSIPNHTIFYIILLIYLSLTALGLCRCVDFSLVLVSGSYSLVIKLLSTMRETQVRSLGQEEPLEKEMATHSDRGLTVSVKRHGERSLAVYSPWRYKE